VSAELGSRDYLRLRVGVGKPAAGSVSDFLLQPLDAAAEQQLDGVLTRARDVIELVARQGIERAMNQVNRQAAVC
jgi:PTH1 family peptidyl-tRNA hydrolase